MNIPTLIHTLKVTYGEPLVALVHHNPFELLVATILSAQCTDKRVNLVTPALFARYPDAQSLAKAKQEDVEDLIRTTGFFRNKAKHLIGMANQLVAKHQGEVPRTLEELTALPGVARKTANVTLGSSFGLAVGIVVDTHVRRLSLRLGLTSSNNPTQIERDLMAQIPQRDWIAISHLLIYHGRACCSARNPRCNTCPLNALCPHIGVSN